MMKFLPRSAFVLLLGFAALGRAAEEPPPTVIECEGLAETISTDTETIATFRDKVVVTGNNIKMSCDYLKVVATRQGDPSLTLGKYGNFRSLIASGKVHILQGDRVATCGRAEIFPGEDKIVLSEEPVVRYLDEAYVAEGREIILYRGERRVTVVHPKIQLPAIKDLGFEQKSAPGSAAPKGSSSK